MSVTENEQGGIDIFITVCTVLSILNLKLLSFKSPIYDDFVDHFLCF